MKYTVWAVDRAGSPWDVYATDDGWKALGAIEALRAANKQNRTDYVYGVNNDDNPESGDYTDRLEEMEFEARENDRLISEMNAAAAAKEALNG